MNRVVRAYPKEDLRVILDNSSSHRTPEALAWLRENRRVQFHYTRAVQKIIAEILAQKRKVEQLETADANGQSEDRCRRPFNSSSR